MHWAKKTRYICALYANNNITSTTCCRCKLYYLTPSFYRRLPFSNLSGRLVFFLHLSANGSGLYVQYAFRVTQPQCQCTMEEKQDIDCKWSGLRQGNLVPKLLKVIVVNSIPQTTSLPFNGLFYRTTWVSRYRKGKTSIDLK